ncbi:hypothetical protein H310_04219 [Aphanomyces invadans]|uniref:START domain-containing protein n=1 Tax=Aphanomyces invadans TaxID=157072 RepID=A0A024UG50_9STRA|nr:hypothetical protein H310_04219 [Aphanomyces invadans]ETW05254.1 hypothetical protein H310_04219 [Aphanomyces invadans]|eukprot:XP_008866692.1 hypothetical protein H310_04219 [Aphanomyces invadans]
MAKRPATGGMDAALSAKASPLPKEWEALARPTDEVDMPDDADMWATVCDLLQTSPVEQWTRHDDDNLQVSGGSSGHEGMPKPKRIRVYTNKAEVQQLEAEINDLQAQLVQAKQIAASASAGEVSIWARTAARLRIDKNKTLDENQQLLAAVRERGEHIQRLQKLVFKTPRWTVLPEVTNESVLYGRLPADPVLRAATIHRIADHQYHRFHTTFVQAGVFDLTEDTCRGEPITLPDEQIGFQSINHINLPAPFRSIANACWQVLSGKVTDAIAATDDQVWEHVDEHTVYHRSRQHNGRIVCHSNEIRKRFDDPTTGRILFVWVSVVDDALVAQEPSDAVDEVWGWWSFGPDPGDPTKCRTTIVGHSNISRVLEHQEVKAYLTDVIAALKRLMVTRASTNLDDPPSFLVPFLERRRRMRPLIRTVMEESIRRHNPTAPLPVAE